MKLVLLGETKATFSPEPTAARTRGNGAGQARRHVARAAGWLEGRDKCRATLEGGLGFIVRDRGYLV
jgi:hypothetical protein